jgi:hypothetical protein
VSANPTIGQPVTFNGSGSTCVVAPCTYAWDDDGAEPPVGSWPLGSGQVMQYTFTGSAFTAYVRLTVTDALGETGTVEHNVYVASASTPAPVNTAAPSIAGTAAVGDRLTASPGTWSGGPTYAYQWSDCNSSGSGCTSIAGATGTTYTVANGDEGHTIEVTVTATNAGGSASATSGPTAVVPTPSSPPSNSQAPSVSGTAVVGDQLTASPGTWSGSPTYAYQWSDCNSSGSGCTNISGATGTAYTVASGDVGHTIEVAVTATNGAGSASAKSGPTAVVTSGSGGSGNGSDANLWVSSSGGSCVRQATAGSEVSSQDCGSLNAAYQAAKCGDVIDIDAGTYPDQNIIDNSSLDNCAENVVFQAAPGLSRSQVVIGNDNGQSIDSGDSGQPSSDWTLQDVTVTNEIQLEACEYSSDAGSCSSPSHGITINDIQGGAMFVWAEDMTIENSNFGPCYNLISLTSGSNDNSAPSPSYSPNPSVKCNQNIKGFGANTVFRNNVVHDFLDDDSNTYYDHFECMFLGQDVNVTIDSNEFYDCQIYAIFIQNAGPGPLTIQNNWFWASQGGMGGCGSNGSCPVENAGGNNDWSITDGDNGGTPTTNVLVRYNSFDPAAGFSNQANSSQPPNSSWRFVGNIIGQGGCQGSITYEYNLWLPGGGGPCGTGDVQMSSGDPFVRTGGSGATPDDLHLRCGTPAQNLVTPNASDYQLSYDIDGNPRNANGPRDAGASAEASCGS